MGNCVSHDSIPALAPAKISDAANLNAKVDDDSDNEKGANLNDFREDPVIGKYLKNVPLLGKR